mgnify:CR=1 FL=1
MISIHIEKSDLIFQKSSEFLINWLRLYHNIGQKTLLLLSGGSATKLYPLLAEFIKTSNLDLNFLAFGQVDERFGKGLGFRVQGLGEKDINSYLIGKTGLWDACKERKIPYYLVSQEGTLEKSADQYNKTIEKLFKEYIYKVAILGIGEDGHTAGLIPGYGSEWDIDKYAVGYDHRQNGPRGPFCPGGFRFRISLTPKVISQLDYGIIVALGEKKRKAIEQALDPINQNNLNKYPAAIIQKIKKVDLFTDICPD